MLLRISPSFPGETSSFLKVDQKKKQVTLYDPTAISHVSQKYRRMGVAAPKMFVFDSIFEPDSSQVKYTALELWCYNLSYLETNGTFKHKMHPFLVV